MAIDLWPALGRTVLDHNGDVISTAGVSLATLTEYYSDLVVEGDLVTFDPLETGDPTVAPGSNASGLSAYLTTQISTLSGTANGQVITLSGRSDVGDGAEGLAVWDDSSTATADNATVWGTGTGRWLRVWDGKSYDARWFGAHPSASAATNAVAIQAAIAAAIAATVRIVLIPSGVYQIDRTIHLGGTLRFTCLELRGEGYAVNAESPYGGTSLVATFSNAPAINIQGARGSIVRDLTIKGPNYDHINDNAMGIIGTPLVEDTTVANWWDSSLSANGATRYAPSAGIAIDGWAGSAPATSYPTTYVAYGQNYSSDVMIENCQISGFNVAIVVQPCDADGNGDFTVIRRCLLTSCVWGISVGNTQSRQVGIQDVKIAQMYCALTNNQHGRQLGKFNGTVDNLSIGSVIQMFEFGTAAYFGPIKFSCCYGESMWRLGNYSSTSSSEQSMSFEQCAFNFHLQDTTRGIPATVLSGSNQPSIIRFTGCTFGAYESVIAFDHIGVVFDQCLMSCFDRENSVPKEYIGIMHNATCGGLIMRYGTTNEEHRIKFPQINLDTLATTAGNIVSQRGLRSSDRKRCIPLYAQLVSSKDDGYSDEQFVHRRDVSWGKSSLSSVTLTHGASSSTNNIGVLTVVFSSVSAAEAENYGYAPGDLIVDDQTHSVFVIRSFDDGTNTVVAELQNNYKISGGNYTTVTAFSTTVGTLYFRNCRLYTPTYPVLADITSGSAVLASTGRDDGYSAFIDTAGTNDAIKVNDRVFVPETTDAWVSASSNKVTAIAAGGGSITLAGNAARTLSRKRLPVWIRKPPANEASR